MNSVVSGRRLFHDLVSVFLPMWKTEDERTAFLDAALFESTLRFQLDTSGSPREATVRVVSTLLQDLQGPGRAALEDLLQEYKRRTGIDEQDLVQDLLRQIAAYRPGVMDPIIFWTSPLSHRVTAAALVIAVAATGMPLLSRALDSTGSPTVASTEPPPIVENCSSLPTSAPNASRLAVADFAASDEAVGRFVDTLYTDMGTMWAIAPSPIQLCRYHETIDDGGQAKDLMAKLGADVLLWAIASNDLYEVHYTLKEGDLYRKLDDKSEDSGKLRTESPMILDEVGHVTLVTGWALAQTLVERNNPEAARDLMEFVFAHSNHETAYESYRQDLAGAHYFQAKRVLSAIPGPTAIGPPELSPVLAALNKADLLHPDNAVIQLAIGEELMNHGKPEDALTEFTKIVDRADFDEDATILALTRRAELQGSEEKAEEDFALALSQKVLETDDELARVVYRKRADWRFHHAGSPGKLEGAIEDYRLVLAFEPCSLRRYNDLAYALHLAGSDPEVLALYEGMKLACAELKSAGTKDLERTKSLLKILATAGEPTASRVSRLMQYLQTLDDAAGP